VPPAVPMTFRTVFLTVLIPVFAPLTVLLLAIWGASSWIANQEAKIATLTREISDIEKVTSRDASQEMRINNLEQRLNWLDEEAKRNRSEGIQVNKEIRDTLERLRDAVTRLESSTFRKRSDIDRLFSPSTFAGSCLRSLSCSADDIALGYFTGTSEGEHPNDQEDHQQSEAQAGQKGWAGSYRLVPSPRSDTLRDSQP